MAERILELNALHAMELLRVLDGLGTHVGVLQEGGMRALLMQGAELRLLLPDPHRRGRDRHEREMAWIALREAVTAITGSDHVQLHPAMDQRAVPLPLAVLWAVLYSGAGGSEVQEASVGEELWVAWGEDFPEMAKALERLSWYATQARVVFQGQGDTRGWILFHVRDDPARRSGLQGLVASGLLQGLEQLLPYGGGQGLTLWLPSAERPAAGAADLYARIIAIAPGLRGFVRELRPGLNLGVLPVAEADERRVFELFPWHADDSVAAEALDPSPAEAMALRVHDLDASQRSHDALREAVRALPREHGYRLSLRRQRRSDGVEHELEVLERRMQDLEDRLEYLRSTQGSFHRLLCFRQDALEQLARVLVRFERADLKRIRYGFQGERRDDDPTREAGVHYLLFDPVQARIIDDLLDLRLHAGSEPIFWQDPYWTGYYQEHNRSMVFVPEGSALFPLLHSWDVDDMDAYLREAVGHWFPEHGAVEALAGMEHPIYVFDRVEGVDDELALTVLDADAMVPMSTRLGWLSDNLLLVEQIGVVPLVEHMAGDVQRRALAERLAADADAAEDRLQQRIEGQRAELGRQLTELLGFYTDELRCAAARVEALFEDLGDVHQRLDAFEAALAAAKADEEAAAKMLASFNGLEQEMAERKTQIEGRVLALISRSEDTQKQLQEKVDNKADELLRTYRRLRERLEQ